MSAEIGNDGKLAIPRAPVIPPPAMGAQPQPPAPTGAALDAIVNGTPPAPTPAPASVPRGTPAPVAPAPVAPVQPVAAAPAPAGPKYATPDMIVQMTVDRKRVDMPVGDLIAKGQMLTAAEERFKDIGRQRAELAGLTREAEIGRVVLAHQNNPEMLSTRLAELTGRPLVVNTKEVEDDGLDAPTRAMKAELSELRAKQARTDQFFASQAVNETMGTIGRELNKYPAYQQDQRLRGRAELVVAAFVSKNPDANIGEIIGELHAEDSAILIERTTLQRDQRAADMQVHATVPSSAATPALTANDPPKHSAEDWQKGPGVFSRGWRNLLNP